MNQAVQTHPVAMTLLAGLGLLLAHISVNVLNDYFDYRSGIDLATIQKYVNLWFTLSLDLFGGEISSNAADFGGGIYDQGTNLVIRCSTIAGNQADYHTQRN